MYLQEKRNLSNLVITFNTINTNSQNRTGWQGYMLKYSTLVVHSFLKFPVSYNLVSI